MAFISYLYRTGFTQKKLVTQASLQILTVFHWILCLQPISFWTTCIWLVFQHQNANISNFRQLYKYTFSLSNSYFSHQFWLIKVKKIDCQKW